MSILPSWIVSVSSAIEIPFTGFNANGATELPGLLIGVGLAKTGEAAVSSIPRATIVTLHARLQFILRFIYEGITDWWQSACQQP